MLIIATGEHGDRNAPGVARRSTVVLIWLLAVMLIAQLTATVTSLQTVERLQSSIRGPDDLPGKTIARVPGTVAGDYLTQRGLPFVSVHNGPDAIRMLTEGEVQAVVFDAPTPVLGCHAGQRSSTGGLPDLPAGEVQHCRRRGERAAQADQPSVARTLRRRNLRGDIRKVVLAEQVDHAAPAVIRKKSRRRSRALVCRSELHAKATCLALAV
jgi:hypothetical protein